MKLTINNKDNIEMILFVFKHSRGFFKEYREYVKKDKLLDKDSKRIRLRTLAALIDFFKTIKKVYF